MSDESEQVPRTVGRPSMYKPEYAETARKLCETLGATDREIADFFEVSETTINNWKTQHPEFLESLKISKEASDNRVEQSLYRRALGYSHDAVKISVNAQGMETITPYVEHYPPDTTAGIFWLKNRRPDVWRDKTDHEHTGKDGKDLVPEVSDTELARRVAFMFAAASKKVQDDSGR